MDYYVVAFYFFGEIEEPQLEVKRHKEFLKPRDAKGRIYISEEGINAQMSAPEEDAIAYMAWIHKDPRFVKISFKVQTFKENTFPRMTIKYRKQLVALDQEVDLSKGGGHVSPEKWREMLESEEDYLVLDVRNDYEWKIGHFEGAEKPRLKTFREFPKYAQDLKKEHDPKKTKVMMYCTGGIRCELYSALMKDEGFDNVFQLEGGVLNYIEEEKGKHWKGKLFVFDDRLSVPVNEESNEVIGECHHCKSNVDSLYNCANTRCNEFFVCCPTCLEAYKGCCQSLCMESPYLRPYQQGVHKPFRKLHHYKDQMKEIN